jgi:YggT family protein
LLNLFVFLIIVAAIMSWLVAFDVVNRRNPAVRMIGDLLYQLTEPALRPIRRRLPNFGSIDISPLVLILIIIFIQMVILPNLAKLFR